MTTRQPTVAIVEDDSNLLRSLNRLLIVSGYRTEIYSSAEQLLDAVAKTCATCFVFDCHIGERSGFDLARQLAATGLSAPVIFMTASDDTSIRKRAIDFGCIAFLKKPFSADQLVNSIENAIGVPLPV